MTESLLSIIQQLANRRVVVIGDVILDEYIYGKVTRISREAPVPVLEFQSREYIAGGAANPSANIAALGSEAIQLGLIGDDENAKHLLDVLGAHEIDSSHLLACSDAPTTVKTRILAQMGLRFPQQIARVDTVTPKVINPETEHKIIEGIQASSTGYDAFLFSDYGQGFLTKTLIEHVVNIARQQDILLTADAQGHLEKYRRFDLVKCNAEDAAQYTGRVLKSAEDFASVATQLLNELDLSQAMVITRGGDGATVATHHGAAHYPAPSVSDVFDTVGAGDTSIAVITLGLCAGASLEDTIRLANIASGIVVRHVGNYTPSAEELKQAVQSIGE